MDVTAVTKHAQLEPAQYTEGRISAGISREIAEGTTVAITVRHEMAERKGQALAGVLNGLRDAAADGKIDLDEVFTLALRSDLSGLVGRE